MKSILLIAFIFFYLSESALAQRIPKVLSHDSIDFLTPVIINAKVHKQKLVGDSTKHKMKGEYGVACGGLLASEIKLVQKAFYLNELSFYLVDYKLPKNKSNLKISITSCHAGKENKSTQTNYFEPFYPVLDVKKAWYTVKLDSTNKKKIESNCIAVKFEVKCDFTEEQQSVIPRNREAFVIFGRAKKAQGVFSWCTDMLFQSAIVGYDNTIPYSQKVFLKITETEK